MRLVHHSHSGSMEIMRDRPVNSKSNGRQLYKERDRLKEMRLGATYLGFYLHIKLNFKHPHCAVTKALLLFTQLLVAAVVFLGVHLKKDNGSVKPQVSVK